MRDVTTNILRWVGIIFFCFLTALILTFPLVNVAFGHGTHLDHSIKDQIGYKYLGYGIHCYFQDLNHNTKRDHVTCIREEDDVIHVIFEDTYAKWCKEFGVTQCVK